MFNTPVPEFYIFYTERGGLLFPVWLYRILWRECMKGRNCLEAARTALSLSWFMFILASFPDHIPCPKCSPRCAPHPNMEASMMRAFCSKVGENGTLSHPVPHVHHFYIVMIHFVYSMPCEVSFETQSTEYHCPVSTLHMEL